MIYIYNNFHLLKREALTADLDSRYSPPGDLSTHNFHCRSECKKVNSTTAGTAGSVYMYLCQCCCFTTFYWSCIESVLTFSFQCWFGGLNVKSRNVLNKVETVCGKAVGERQEHLSQLYERMNGRLR